MLRTRLGDDRWQREIRFGEMTLTWSAQDQYSNGVNWFRGRPRNFFPCSDQSACP
jgi:hypothetical protein